ncbi:serine protease inhibitor serpin 1c [Aphelenchoides avenae]|nr:serine protease inhibitor serpin 1c [Aphelenchus avenae]
MHYVAQYGIRSIDGAEVCSVSRVYISDNWKVLPTFSNAARDTYDAMLESVDFSQAEQLAQEVNAFVAATTKNRIQAIVSEEDFAETSAMLVNATYFEAKWMKPFDASSTHTRSFNKDVATSIQIPMMQTIGEFLYRSDDTYELLLLPYVGEQYSLLILLPRQRCSLRRMIQKIDGYSILQSVERAAKRSLEVIIPKFKLEQKMDLRKALISMGVHSAFDPANADFSGIAEGSHGLFMGKVVQKASIDVDEEGTVAAAATSVALRTCSADVPVYQKFVADHPFLYSVMDSDGNAFFTGTFAG